MSAAEVKDLQDVVNAFSHLFVWGMVLAMIFTGQRPHGLARILWWIALLLGFIAGAIRIVRFFL